jgi:predicted small secreted protein
MSQSAKFLVTILVCALMGAAVSGCNTVKGAGKDIERGGEKVQGAAEGAKSN